MDDNKHFPLEEYENFIRDLKLIKQQIDLQPKIEPIKPISPKVDDSEILKNIKTLESRLKSLIEKFPYYTDLGNLNNILNKSNNSELKEREEELKNEKDKFDNFIKQYQTERKQKLEEISQLLMKIKEEKCNKEVEKIIIRSREYLNDDKSHSIGLYEANIISLKKILEKHENPKDYPKLNPLPRYNNIESKEDIKSKQPINKFSESKEKKNNNTGSLDKNKNYIIINPKYTTNKIDPCIMDEIKIIKEMLRKYIIIYILFFRIGTFNYGEEAKIIINKARKLADDKEIHKYEEYENCIKKLNDLLPPSEPPPNPHFNRTNRNTPPISNTSVVTKLPQIIPKTDDSDKLVLRNIV